MTLEELRESTEPTIGAKAAAELLQVNAYALTIQARKEGLPFDFMFSGNRLKISRQSLLEWIDGIEVARACRTVVDKLDGLCAEYPKLRAELLNCAEFLELNAPEWMVKGGKM